MQRTGEPEVGGGGQGAALAHAVSVGALQRSGLREPELRNLPMKPQARGFICLEICPPPHLGKCWRRRLLIIGYPALRPQEVMPYYPG